MMDEQLQDKLGLIGLDNSKYDWLLAVFLLGLVVIATYSTSYSPISMLHGVLVGILWAGLRFLHFKTEKSVFYKLTWFLGLPLVVVSAYFASVDYRFIFICCSYIPMLMLNTIMRYMVIRNFQSDQ